ncbi:MAG: hypothetical protein JWO31_674, partial [Phycisphaerales bacterium]|nr:hypothetical protein [Phycisphaerales bacterium]
MPDLPPEAVESPTVAAIYAKYESRCEGPRRYLGASVIGKPCDRALWYDFRWCGREQFAGRMVRLFETGHLEEHRFVHNLRSIGCDVRQYADDKTLEQFAVSAVGGHFKGHTDGAVLGLPEAPKTWHLAEYKTHNHKSFTTLKSKGVAAHKPEHFAQMQVYMHLQGLTRAIYLAVNKNDDELYAERVKADAITADRYLARARSIVTAAEPPDRISSDPSAFGCKFCNHRDRCHGNPDAPAAPVGINCRTCCHATPVVDDARDDGPWRCDRHAKPLAEQEQARGCGDHLLIPLLINGAAPIDGSAEHVEYRTPEGHTFANGRRPGDYSSAELAAAPVAALASPLAVAAKASMGGT